MKEQFEKIIIAENGLCLRIID